MKTAQQIAQELDLPPDDVLVLQTVATKLLIAAGAGKIDLNELARVVEGRMAFLRYPTAPFFSYPVRFPRR